LTNVAESRPDPWAKVWQAMSSDRLLFFLLGLLALSVLIALWFPQAPRSVYQQDGGVESWLTTARPKLGRPADTLLALGFLTVARATWFRLILAGVGLTLLLRAFDAAQRLRRFPTTIRPAITHKLMVSAEPPAALEAVGACLGPDLRYQIEDEPRRRLVAYRPRASLGPLCVALGGLIMLAGWLWGEAAGWELARLRLTEETPAAISPTGQTLHLETLNVQWGEEERATSASGRLALWNDDLIAAGEVDLDTDWRWHGVTYRLTAVGPAVRVQGEGAEGAPLLLQTAAHRPPAEEVTLLLAAEDGPRSFAAPEEGIVAQVEALPAGEAPGVRLRAYQGRAGELVEDRTINGEASFELDGSHFSLSVIPYAEVTASYIPGRWLVVAGISLALVGVLVSLGYRPRQLEAVATAGEGGAELVLSAARPSDSTWLEALANQLNPEEQGAEHGK